MTGLPHGWQELTLGHVAKWTSGGTPSSKNSDFYDGDIPWICIGDLNEGSVLTTAKKITKAGLDSSSAKIMPKGTVMLAMYATSIGDTGIMETNMATNQAIACGVPKPEVIDGKYLLYYLQSQKHEFFAAGRGGAQPNINQGIVKGWPIPVPPIGEQHRIVELLEDHLSRLEVALADVNKAKIKATQFRRSLLLSFLYPEVAQISSDWSRTTLASVCDLVAGKTPPSLERSIEGLDDSSRIIPFYKVGDMNLDPDYLCKSRLYLSEKQVKERNLFILPLGSVVFPKTGGAIATNKKRVVSIPGPIDLNCMAAIPKIGTNPRYLSWWFQSINLSTYADGSILPQLSKGKMSEIPVMWPNIKLQEKIVLSIEESLSRNSEAIKLAEAIEVNALSLRRSLLQSAFTGQLTKEVVSV
jgi:type I restriction enzyme, S subunit